MNVTLDRWLPLGSASLASDGRLVLPSAPSAPGVYRFRLVGPPLSVYIGETDHLPRRFSNYRNPSPSQRTNIRMNERMRSHLAAGGVVEVDVVTLAWIQVGTEREPLDLVRKSHRMLAEEAALEEARSGGMGTVENIGG